jgi:hypothetical protein
VCASAAVNPCFGCDLRRIAPTIAMFCNLRRGQLSLLSAGCGFDSHPAHDNHSDNSLTRNQAPTSARLLVARRFRFFGPPPLSAGLTTEVTSISFKDRVARQTAGTERPLTARIFGGRHESLSRDARVMFSPKGDHPGCRASAMAQFVRPSMDRQTGAWRCAGLHTE